MGVGHEFYAGERRASEDRNPRQQRWRGSKPLATTEHRCALVLKDGTLFEVNYDNQGQYLEGSKRLGDAIAICQLCQADATWVGKARGAEGESLWTIGHKTAQEAATAVLAKMVASATERAALLADPAKHLERELKVCDWYSNYSDDHAVWSGGERHMKLIQELLRKVPVETARQLWQQHAPEGFVCPI